MCQGKLGLTVLNMHGLVGAEITRAWDGVFALQADDGRDTSCECNDLNTAPVFGMDTGRAWLPWQETDHPAGHGSTVPSICFGQGQMRTLTYVSLWPRPRF